MLCCCFFVFFWTYQYEDFMLMRFTLSSENTCKLQLYVIKMFVTVVEMQPLKGNQMHGVLWVTRCLFVLQMGLCDEETPEHPPAGKTRNRTTQGEVSRSRRPGLSHGSETSRHFVEVGHVQPRPPCSVCRHVFLTDDPHDRCCKPVGKIVGTNYSKFCTCIKVELLPPP